MVVLVSIISIVLAILVILSIIYVFVDDTKTFNYIFKNAFELAFKKTKQEEYIQSTTDFLNKYFRNIAQDVVSSKDKTLMETLGVGKNQVVAFKKTMNRILQDPELEFVSEGGVRQASEKNNSFNLLNLIVENTQLFSNDKAILAKELTDQHKADLINDKQYFKKLMGLQNLTPSQAKAKLMLIRKHQKEENSILPFATKFVNDNHNNIQTMYDMSLKQQLI